MNRRDLFRIAALAAATPAVATDSWAASPATLRLTPEATQGPFWFDPHLLRADITEGARGVPLALRLTVLEADGRPISNAVAEIWHCDAQGVYSGYEGRPGGGQAGAGGKTYLRGGQATDALGRVAFQTLYPGWYEGRAPHIHLKIMLREDTVLTSQIFLPDALSEFLYANVGAYERKCVRDTLNRQDGIARSLGGFTAADLREEADRYVASMTIVVDRAARSSEPFGGGPPPLGLAGGPPPGAPPSGGPPPFATPLRGAARLSALIPGLDKA
jgi:protocatechuate 3,4-dioxygenase beta subunit